MEKIGITDKTDFYDNARSARNEKAQRRVGDLNKNDIDASGWKEPTMETERKTGGRPEPRAYKRGGKVDGKADNPHAGRAKRASGGKIEAFNKKVKEDVKSMKHSKGCTCKMCSGGMAKADGGKANYEGGTRPDGGRIAKASGGKLMGYLDDAKESKKKAAWKIDQSSPKEILDHAVKTYDKRDKGIKMAKSKLGGLGKVPPSYEKREPHKKGGKVKGKTHINININSAPKPVMPMDVPPPAGAMPPPAMMPKPMPPAGPMPPMAGGLPPGLGVPPPAMGAGPLLRKSGGRASYKDMTAGAGSGPGRLEKTEIQKRN